MLKEFQKEKKYPGEKKQIQVRQTTACGWMESLLKLGPKEMEKEKFKCKK